MPAIITLTTDFGLRDPYVAEMKAVILCIARDVHLVDITHDVAPHDIAEGALALEAAALLFPRGTVHVAVVDPGVGTARRGLVLVSRDQVFVGPDNGLFTAFLREEGWEAYALTAEEFRRPRVSPTFHGRDIFTPAAAHVARGLDVRRLGPVVRDPVRLTWPEGREATGEVAGAVVHIDRFGNLVTSVRAEAVRGLGAGAVVHVAGCVLRLVETYGDLSEHEAGGLIGSRHRLEVAMREGRAEALLGAKRGTPVRVSRSSRSSPKNP